MLRGSDAVALIQTPTPESQTHTVGEPPWPPSAYAWYVVAVLLLAYTLSFVDRMILSLLIAPLRDAFEISDTQVSLLLGLAFALFYTLLGLPLAWFADRGNRRNLILTGLAVWSVMTASCGLASSYSMLFLARMGVGVGEATLSPSAYSMLSDYFPREKLARAIAVYSIGVPLGSGIALVLGAFVVKAALAAPIVTIPGVGIIDAWRLIFMAVASPGVIVAALLLTIREPHRRGRIARNENRPAAGDRNLMQFTMSHPAAIGALLGAMSLISLVMYGVLAWIPTFFARSYAMDASDAGIRFGFLMAISGAGGLLLGGTLSDSLYRKGIMDAHLRIVRLSVLLGGPLIVATPLMPNAGLAFAMLAPALLFMTMHGVAGAALQLITPNEIRAQITAIYFFLANLVGLGLGPTSIALATDFIFQDDTALRYSIALVAALALPPAAIILTLGLKPYARCMKEATHG